MTKLAFLVVVLACGAGPSGSGAHDVPVIVVTSNVGDAHLYMDGRLVGPVRGLAEGIAIDPGIHRLEVRHDDHFSRYAEVTLGRGQKLRLHLEMSEILP